MRLCPQERRASHRNRSEERPRRQYRRLPRIHEEIREEYSQLVHRRSGGTSSGGFLQAEHPFTVQDIIEVVTYINYSQKRSSDHQSGLPWEIEVHVITTLLSADRQASPRRSEVLDTARTEDSTFAYEKQGGHSFQARSDEIDTMKVMSNYFRNCRSICQGTKRQSAISSAPTSINI